MKKKLKPYRNRHRNRRGIERDGTGHGAGSCAARRPRGGRLAQCRCTGFVGSPRSWSMEAKRKLSSRMWRTMTRYRTLQSVLGAVSRFRHLGPLFSGAIYSLFNELQPEEFKRVVDVKPDRPAYGAMVACNIFARKGAALSFSFHRLRVKFVPLSQRVCRGQRRSRWPVRRDPPGTRPRPFLS